MGNYNSSQQKSILNEQKNDRNHKNNINWEILQKNDFRQILKSKRTQLVVQRYSYEMQQSQVYEKQNKIYEWRNKNPNHEFIINVLSVNKDQIQLAGCGSSGLCPSTPIHLKIYVVTQRILKIFQIPLLISTKLQIEQNNQQIHATSINITQNHQQKINLLTQTKSKYIKQKMKPFLTLQVNELESKRIIKDWVRGIQILCYKFGYFKITKQLLGITVNKRGNVWINQNYSINQIHMKSKINVNTAQQKYKFEKETIQNIFSIIEKIQWFTSITKKLQKAKIIKFDQFFKALDKISIQSRSIQKSVTSTTKKIEQKKILSSQQIPLIKRNSQISLPQIPLTSLKLINSKQPRQYSYDQKDMKCSPNNFSKDSSRKQDYRQNVLNQFMRDKGSYQIFVHEKERNSQEKYNSNHRNCGRQTAPTINQLGHSSQLNSINNNSNHRPQVIFNQKQNADHRKNLSRSQNTIKQFIIGKQPKKQPKQFTPSQKSNPSQGVMYFPQMKNSQPYMYRSQSFNFPSQNLVYHNISVDETNLVGPYQKDKYFKNLNKQKISLVDSMVIVQEQSQDISQADLLNISGAKIILEESIIIRGGNENVHNISREGQTARNRSKNY